MDLNPLDLKAPNGSNGSPRYRVSGDVGFQSIMDLAARRNPTEPVRPEPSRRPETQRDASSRIDDHHQDEAPDSVRVEDDGRVTSSETADGRRSEPQVDDPSASAAIAVEVAKPTAASGRTSDTGEPETAAVDGAPLSPAIPQLTPTPTPVGVPVAGQPVVPAHPAVPVPPSATPTPLPAAVAPPAAAAAQTVAGQPAPQQAAAPVAAAAATTELPSGMTPLATAAQASERAPGVGSAQKPSDSTSTQRTSAPTATPASSSAAPAATAAAASPGAPDSRTLRGATVTVEPATVVARTQGVSSAVLVQAHLAAAGDAGAKVAVQPGQSAAATQAGTTLHVGGGQPLFVGADAGAAQSGGQGSNGAGGQSGNNSQNGGQPNGGQAQANGGFTFGTATIGQRGFGGDAARAQFQEILETRTARAPLQGPGGTGSMSAGATSTLATSSMTAGPGGPQSTLPAAMASRAEATAHGRPGALPGTAVGQVAVKLVSSAADGGGRMTVRLNPEELGKVDVKLEFGRDGMVRALISAERPETLEMLQRDSRALEKALQEAGLKTDQNSLEFDLRGGHGQPTERDEHGVASGPASSATAEQSAEADAQPDTQTGSGSVREDGSYDLVA